jgi:hypothetical protein
MTSFTFSIDADMGLAGGWRNLQVPIEFLNIAKTNPQIIDAHSQREFLRELTSALMEGRIIIAPRHVMAALVRDHEARFELLARKAAREDCADFLNEEGFIATKYEK